MNNNIEMNDLNGFCYVCNKKSQIIIENGNKVCKICKDTFIMESNEDYDSSDFIPVKNDNNNMNQNVNENNRNNSNLNVSFGNVNNNINGNGIISSITNIIPLLSSSNILMNNNTSNTNNIINSNTNNSSDIFNHFTNRTFRIFNNIMNDDTIRTLMSQITQGTSMTRPPASKEEIENLDTLIISDKNINNFADMECLICRENYNIGEEICKLRCGHYNHKECILIWLKQHNNCPICRYELKTDDPVYESNKNRS